jgi:hypothetical protein
MDPTELRAFSSDLAQAAKDALRLTPEERRELRGDNPLGDRLAALEASQKASAALLYSALDRLAALEQTREVSRPPTGFLCVKRAAWNCHYSESSVRKWIRQGTVNYIRWGGRLLVEVATLPK